MVSDWSVTVTPIIHAVMSVDPKVGSMIPEDLSTKCVGSMIQSDLMVKLTVNFGSHWIYRIPLDPSDPIVSHWIPRTSLDPSDPIGSLCNFWDRILDPIRFLMEPVVSDLTMI